MDADVIVIGAGAAGLAAARRLAEGALRVIVLEGRDRAGGRVMWRPVGSVDVPAELGAEFIHGAAPETTALMREAGLTAVATGGLSWERGADGALRATDDDLNPGDLFERAAALDVDESVDVFLRRFERDPKLGELAARARAFVEGFEAADPALASARAIADELRSGVDETSSRPVGSYAPLIDHAVRACADAGADLRFGTTVERVTWQPGEVTIDARDAGGEHVVLRARCAVVTVPVGVLRERDGVAKLTFAPPLPQAKQVALRGLEMGHVVRVVLAFRTPFWERIAGGRYRDAAFFRGETGAFAAFWTQFPIRSRSIVAWAGGPRATAMAGVPDAERIERARDAFAGLFDEPDLVRSEYEGGVTHDWSGDPFAYGAYSYVATGGGAARDALGAPVEETLFFAGEATASDGQGGTVSGAFATGLRAADEVVRTIAARC